MAGEDLRRQLRDEGFCIVPSVLDGDMLARVRAALDQAIEDMRAADLPLHDVRLDPNPANIRVYNLPEHDPVFTDLLRWPAARAIVEEVLGSAFIVSNFTANIALPGSGSMKLHSDQALVIPEPWTQPWALNIIWCLDDIYAENGATRYIPGSHHYRTFDDVPADAESRMHAFQAPAGSFIAMDGRLWHTSGANVTADRQRRQMFAYYSRDFIRPQVNWEAMLSAGTKAGLDEDARILFGLGKMANVRIGGSLTRLRPA